METQAWITLALLIIMFALLVRGQIPTWLVFMGTLTVMITLQLASVEDLLKGFSNSRVITVGVLFVVPARMYSTGAITLLSDKLIGCQRHCIAPS
jgi:Mg2+/citrate symporter